MLKAKIWRQKFCTRLLMEETLWINMSGPGIGETGYFCSVWAPTHIWHMHKNVFLIFVLRQLFAHWVGVSSEIFEISFLNLTWSFSGTPVQQITICSHAFIKSMSNCALLYCTVFNCICVVQTLGWLTISLRAPKVSVSPILAAAHASGEVSASRIASSSCKHHQQSLNGSTHRSNHHDRLEGNVLCCQIRQN